jgi:hypothetical protein
MRIRIRIQLFTPFNADPDPVSKTMQIRSATLIVTMSGPTLGEEMFGILVGHVAVLGILQATPGQPQRLLPVLHKAYFAEQNMLKFVASNENGFLYRFKKFRLKEERVCFVQCWGSVTC